MAAEDPDIARELQEQRDAVSAIRSLGLRELQDDICGRYWGAVFNRMERRFGWVLVIAGCLLTGGYAIYEFVTAPSIHAVYRIGVAALIVGFGMLLCSTYRLCRKLGAYDRYKEVIR